MLSVGQRFAHLRRGANRAQRVVLVQDRDAEDRHHRVADELLDDAAVSRDDRLHRAEVLRHEQAQHLEVELLSEPRRVDEVGEEHRHRLPHLAWNRLRARADEHVCAPVLAQLECRLERLARAVADDDVAGLREADEPRRRGNRRAHGDRVAADDHLAALERDPQGQRLAERARQPSPRRERGVRRLRGVIVPRERREQRADQPLLDGAAGGLDLGRGLVVQPVEERGRLEGVVLELVRRVQRGEEDRDALPLERLRRVRLASAIGSAGASISGSWLRICRSSCWRLSPGSMPISSSVARRSRYTSSASLCLPAR